MFYFRTMNYIFLLLIVVGAGVVIKVVWSKKSWNTPNSPFPSDWRIIFVEKVSFYSSLSEEEKKQFEFKVQEFLLNCRITGIDLTLNLTDKLLVAASAVIPIFAFPDWKYTNLFEVLLYPSSFNDKHETSGNGRSILGMVGSGYMNGKMILSRPSLYKGFSNETDKKNTAIHEFVHLIDKADGVIDGVPSLLLEKQYAIPWIDLINKNIEEIYEGKSDINPYGGTNRAEFFSVISEYFFERPKLFESKHPKLYELMEKIFDQDMGDRNLNREKHSIGRNDPCPCGNGKKFKNCCGKGHY